MVDNSEGVVKWIVVASVILSSLLIGLALNRIVLVKLRGLADKTRWGGDQMIIDSFGRMPFYWCVLAGLYIVSGDLALRPDFASALRKILLTLVIISVTTFCARVVSGFVMLYARRLEVGFGSTSIFINLARAVVFTLGALVVLQSLDIAVTPLLTALGVGGLAVALALQSTLSDLFAGLQIIASRQVRPGDYVKLDSGEEGYVSDITWRNTSIRSLPNNMIVVPNSKMASSLVTNYYQPDKEMAVLMQVGVGYGSDLERVEQVTNEVSKEIMREIQGGISEFEPFIRYHTFDNSSINFTVILRAREYTDQHLIKHEFIKRLHDRYRREGIEIPFPIRTLYLSDGAGGTGRLLRSPSTAEDEGREATMRTSHPR